MRHLDCWICDIWSSVDWSLVDWPLENWSLVIGKLVIGHRSSVIGHWSSGKMTNDTASASIMTNDQ